jgi:branched-subunit amino acid ABC-type transport system permease component
MEVFIQQLINGLTLGGLYALIALGYTMVYGVIQLINFAHGEFFAAGGYVGVILLSYLGAPGSPDLSPGHVHISFKRPDADPGGPGQALSAGVLARWF